MPPGEDCACTAGAADTGNACSTSKPADHSALSIAMAPAPLWSSWAFLPIQIPLNSTERRSSRLFHHVREQRHGHLRGPGLVAPAENRLPQGVDLFLANFGKLRCLRHQGLYLHVSAGKLRLIFAHPSARRGMGVSTGGARAAGSAVFGKRLCALIRIDSHPCRTPRFPLQFSYRQAVKKL
jgi:hypothetical protein